MSLASGNDSKAATSSNGNRRAGNAGEDSRINRDDNPVRKKPHFEPSDPRRDDDWLDAWLQLPRLPLTREQIPLLGQDRLVEWYNASYISARMRNGRSVDFIYNGGSEPGTMRNVQPVFLFTVPEDLTEPDMKREPVYLLAHCLKRQAARTFRLDRISL